MPGFVRYSQVASSSPIKIGFKFTELELEQLMGDGMIELHAAVKVLNDAGGVNGRPIEIVAEDDGTDPKGVPKH